MAPRTTHAAGQAARATAGTNAIEVKVTLAEDQQEAAMRTLGLDRERGEARRVFFFDTRDLDLLKKGVALRARELPGDRCDSTVKIRPVEPEEVPAKWHKKSGFKVEADAVGAKTIRSASLTVPHQRGEPTAVASGKRPIAKLFNADQESFLREVLPAVGVDYAQLVSLGPVAARCWRIRNDGLPYEIRAEEWRLPDGRDFLELSIKADRAQAAAAQAAFTGFLCEIGLEPVQRQTTKTRVALEYFARRA